MKNFQNVPYVFERLELICICLLMAILMRKSLIESYSSYPYSSPVIRQRLSYCSPVDKRNVTMVYFEKEANNL